MGGRYEEIQHGSGFKDELYFFTTGFLVQDIWAHKKLLWFGGRVVVRHL